VQNSGLEIYAKVEDLLGVNEVAPKLYRYYYDILDSLEFNSLLDIGCGSGTFLSNLSKQFSSCTLLGIDKSQHMTLKAKEKGLEVYCGEIKTLNKQFDIATATFDMVNYLNKSQLIEFFNDLKSLIVTGGYFIFDVNSEYGLSELAVGSFIHDESDRFVAIDSFYEDGVYDSEFTLFEKEGGLYKKSQGRIKQYLHTYTQFNSLDGWKLLKSLKIRLYEMQDFDKEIYILQRQ